MKQEEVDLFVNGYLSDKCSQFSIRPNHMNSTDTRYICFYSECINEQIQIFSDKEAWIHKPHQNYCRPFNSLMLQELITSNQPCINSAKQVIQCYLLSVFNSKLNFALSQIRTKYCIHIKELNSLLFQQFQTSTCEERAKRIKAGKASQDLWFVNNLFHKEEESIKEGLINQMMLITSEIGPQIQIQSKLMSKVIEKYDFNVILNLKQKLQQRRENKQSIKQEQIQPRILIPLSISSNSEMESPIYDKTKFISKRGKGRPKREKGLKQYIRKQLTTKKTERGKMQIKHKEQKMDNSGEHANVKIKLKKRNIGNQLIVSTHMHQNKLIQSINHIQPQKIIINAAIDFTNTFFRKINYSKEKIIKFQELWDFGDHYNSYINFLYFPSGQKDTEKRTKLHFTETNWRSLKNLQNIWISSHKDLLNLRRAKFNVKKIRQLRIQHCLCCKEDLFLMDEIFECFKQVRTLECLTLSRLIFDQYTCSFLFHLLSYNKGITCLILDTVSNLNSNIIKYLSHCKLKKLCIIGYDNPHLDLTPIFSIESIQYLTLQRLNLGKEEQIRAVQNLKNLHHLDLYRCSPAPSIFNYLPTKITHLNLGYTDTEDSIIPSIAEFTELKQLNLDSTSFSLQALLKERRGKSFTNIEVLSIFNYNQQPLSIRNSRDKFVLNNETFQMIATIFPNLTYLALGYDIALTRIDLSIFKKLELFSIDLKHQPSIDMDTVGEIQIVTTHQKEKR